MRVEIWSDIVCPWCYIGKARFEQGLAAFEGRDGVEVVHRSFELDASARREPDGKPVTEMLAGKYGVPLEQAKAMEARVADAAAGEGLTYRTDRLHSGTFDLHRVVHLAKDRGLQDAVLGAFYRANFAEAKPIADDEAVVEAAASAGLDADEVRKVLADPTAYADAVRADEAEAQALGISGVPFFVIDRKYGISGGQPAEVFTQALRQAAAENPLQMVSAQADAPACEDGACDVPGAGAK
ncbi:DsbA family oxidoreductase [Streptomyces sp. NPDC051940]|uniref:DsbA family oxidoreductase n=1 Tax=Streptomyces sp. NPDC051940 TaxID=3155675 RepID=UPI00341C7DFE